VPDQRAANKEKINQTGFGRRELRFPERVLCDTNPEQAAGAFGLPGPEARVLPQKSPPLPGPQSEASTSPRAKERAVGAGGRRLEGFPSFKLRLLGVTGRIRSFRFRDVNPNLREADKKEMKKPITWRESTTRLLGGKSKRQKPV
ncbi:hypothetical protein E2I00_001398, partial [Balaenoptera physalus]